MRADEVPVPGVELHLNIRRLHVGTPANVDSGGSQRRPDIDEAQHETLFQRGHGTFSVPGA